MGDAPPGATAEVVTAEPPGCGVRVHGGRSHRITTGEAWSRCRQVTTSPGPFTARRPRSRSYDSPLARDASPTAPRT